MTLDEQKLAVCEKLPELVSTKIGFYPKWKSGYAINWTTEGLQVCHEATKLGIRLTIEFTGSEWIITSWDKDSNTFVVTNKNLFEAWIEVISRVLFPERFTSQSP